MIDWDNFAKQEISVKVTKDNITDFLQKCEEKGMRWRHGVIPTRFNPIEFYRGHNKKYIEPVEDVNDSDSVYILCLYGVMHFTFELNWLVSRYINY